MPTSSLAHGMASLMSTLALTGIWSKFLISLATNSSLPVTLTPTSPPLLSSLTCRRPTSTSAAFTPSTLSDTLATQMVWDSRSTEPRQSSTTVKLSFNCSPLTHVPSISHPPLLTTKVPSPRSLLASV
eukprot:PhF_6_TR38643/c0_g1_i1/m.57689